VLVIADETSDTQVIRRVDDVSVPVPGNGVAAAVQEALRRHDATLMERGRAVLRAALDAETVVRVAPREDTTPDGWFPTGRVVAIGTRSDVAGATDTMFARRRRQR
jgi:hypothetical protein